jgi:hypothetical protein
MRLLGHVSTSPDAEAPLPSIRAIPNSHLIYLAREDRRSEGRSCRRHYRLGRSANKFLQGPSLRRPARGWAIGCGAQTKLLCRASHRISHLSVLYFQGNPKQGGEPYTKNPKQGGDKCSREPFL